MKNGGAWVDYIVLINKIEKFGFGEFRRKGGGGCRRVQSGWVGWIVISTF